MILSITGNRDISEKQEISISKKIFDILEGLLEKHDNITLYSPLADGVDRIIVKVILESFKESNIKIKVPIPMSLDIYKETFGKGLKKNIISQIESIKEFEDLCSSINKFSKDNLFINIEFNEEKYLKSSIEERRIIRQNQYRKLGEFLNEQSDILLAVYNESREKKIGGTIEVSDNFKLLKPQNEIIEIKLLEEN